MAANHSFTHSLTLIFLMSVTATLMLMAVHSFDMHLVIYPPHASTGNGYMLLCFAENILLVT